MVSITVAVPPLVTLLGLILWFAFETKNPKVSTMGERMFTVGLLATLLLFGGFGTRIH